MVVVYFETPSKSFSEIVAVFDCERTYNLCLEALEKEAERAGMIITESCDLTREEVFNLLKTLDMSEEQKYEMQVDISEILNDTGAYNQITDIIKRKYNIELDSDSPIFNYIEEAIVDTISSID